MSSLINVEKLYTVNFFDLSPSFNTSVHNHSDWEFLYVDSGGFDCVIEGESRFIRQGEVLFHQPHEKHRTVCNGKNAASIFNMHFITYSPSMEYFKGKVITVTPTALDTLKKLINECSATYRVSEHPMELSNTPPLGGEQMTILLLEEFLILLMRDSENGTTNAKTPVNQTCSVSQIEEICEYLKANVYWKITLNDLVERFHFSKSFLCEQFKINKGNSPINYFLELKITEAKRLLREDDVTITEIAEKLSFESPEYFSRYFKKCVGRSPRDYRKMLINDASLRKIK